MYLGMYSNPCEHSHIWRYRQKNSCCIYPQDIINPYWSPKFSFFKFGWSFLCLLCHCLNLYTCWPPSNFKALFMRHCCILLHNTGKEEYLEPCHFVAAVVPFSRCQQLVWVGWEAYPPRCDIQFTVTQKSASTCDTVYLVSLTTKPIWRGEHCRCCTWAISCWWQKRL